MLAGDNSILQRATDAKVKTEKAQIIENAQTDILGKQTENKGENITKEQLAEILNKYFNPTDPTIIPDKVSSTSDIPLTTIDEKYTIKLSEIFQGRFLKEKVVTFGEKYEDTMVGKLIDYKSEKNNVNEWIILGKQTREGKNDIIITTKNPMIEKLAIDCSLQGWCTCIERLDTACKNYIGETGKLGTKNAQIVNVRSITLDDINSAVGFTPPQQFDEFTFSSIKDYENKQVDFCFPNETNKTWINPKTSGTTWKYLSYSYMYSNWDGNPHYQSNKTDWNDVILPTSNFSKAENMLYVAANKEAYWLASRSVYVDSDKADFSLALEDYGWVYSNGTSNLTSSYEGYGEEGQAGTTDSRAIRPIVVLSSEIPWNDVKDLIGNYATY